MNSIDVQPAFASVRSTLNIEHVFVCVACTSDLAGISEQYREPEEQVTPGRGSLAYEKSSRVYSQAYNSRQLQFCQSI
jgi:hypothetical protein